MKETLLDIKEITDSREMYESKPRPFISAFIYIFLAIIIIAITYMSFATIDIVIKANGVVRPNSGVSTVKNLIAGDIETVNYENGQKVKQGDLLFTLDHSAADIRKDALTEQIEEKTKELKLLNKYKQAVQQEKNLFHPINEEVYYNRYEKFLLDYQMNEHELNYYTQLNDVKLESYNNRIQELNTTNHTIQLFEKSIQEKSNHIKGSGSEAIYYQSQYEKYILDYHTIEQQYDDKALDITLSKKSELSQKNLLDIQTEMKGYELIKKSLDKGFNAFLTHEEELVLYEEQYKSYLVKIKELETIYEDSKDNYALNLSLKDLAVTNKQIDKAKQDMDQAFNSLENHKMNYYMEITNHITDLEIQCLELDSVNNYEQEKDTILKNNQLSKERALNKFKTDQLVSLRHQKETNKSTIEQIEQSKAQLKVETTKQLTKDTGEYTALSYYKTNESVNTLNQIEGLEQEVDQLQNQLEQVNKEIEQAVVKAQMDGRVNILTDIVKGDTVFGGTHILNIVPENDTALKVQLLLHNKDVAKVTVGEPIKYNFQALPYREYGQLTGYITKISTDTRTDEATGQSYYTLEAALNQNLAYDYKGKESEIKVGMLCEAQVITDKKTILRFLLEKIDLLD